MYSEEQDIRQFVFDQVMKSRGEMTWNDKHLDVLWEASLLKVQHFQRSLKKNLKAEQKEARERLKLKTERKQRSDYFVSSSELKLKEIREDDLLNNMKLDEEYIAIEVMKGLSVIDACASFYGNSDAETWQAATPQKLEVGSE